VNFCERNTEREKCENSLRCFFLCRPIFLLFMKFLFCLENFCKMKINQWNRHSPLVLEFHPMKIILVSSFVCLSLVLSFYLRHQINFLGIFFVNKTFRLVCAKKKFKFKMDVTRFEWNYCTAAINFSTSPQHLNLDSSNFWKSTLIAMLIACDGAFCINPLCFLFASRLFKSSKKRR
jgi:hypothetical protein